METAVLAFFKQENVLYMKSYLSENLIATFQSSLKNITLLPAEKFGNISLYQQAVLLKTIYDFRIEISFMEKYKFLISKKLNSDMYFQ